MEEQKLRETVVWLSGLISCDGSVTEVNNGNTLHINIASTEIDWINKMKQRLQEVGIQSSIHPYPNRLAFKLYLKNPFFVRNLLLRYASSYMIPRKLEVLKKPYSNRHMFSESQQETIKTLFRNGVSISKIAKEINRSSTGAIKYLKRNNLYHR